MVERRFCTPEVRSSILLGSTDTKISPASAEGYFCICWARTASKLLCLRENRIRGRETISDERSEEVVL